MRRWQASRSIGLSFVVLVSASLFLAGCGGDSNAKIKLTRSEVRALYERGTESLKGRDFETAIASFDCVLDSDPSFDRSAYNQAPFERGRARLEAKQARLALDDFEQHIQFVMSNPDENQAKNLANAHLHRGKAYAVLGQLPTAVRDYSQAIALDPSNNEAYRHRGQAYAQLSAHPPRLATPNGDSQAGSPSNGPPNTSQAGPERSAEDYFTAALDDFEHLLSKDSKDAETLVAHGKMYVAKRRMYEAIRDFTAAIDAGDKQASAYIERGKAFAAVGTPDDIKSAISDFDKALAAEPKCAEAFYHRGLAYAEVIGSTDSMDLAIADLTEAIKHMPDASEFLLARGKIYAKTGNDEEAIADLQRAAELNPQSGEAHFELGLALGRRGNLPDCSETLQRAVALDPAYLTKLKSRVLMGYRGTKLVVDAVLPTGQLRCSQGRIYLADSDAARRAGDRARAQELLDMTIGYLTAAKLEDPRRLRILGIGWVKRTSAKARQTWHGSASRR